MKTLPLTMIGFFTATLMSICAGQTFAQTIDNSKASSPNSPIDFSRDIQPILSENCYFCHGQDANRRQADLRLDNEADARAAIEPKDAASSDLFLRICSTDPDEQMPPPDSNRSLTKEQIQLIKLWINQGAKWSQHWAFAPIEPQEIDATESLIDHYVIARLRENGLTHSQPATRRTLVRRVSLDLTGLPPTPEQVDLFLNDKSDNAYSEMVDRFLDSPAYGERMAWVWLDAARYADTNGYQGDNERTMWPWRDWVVKAYNENMPFDQFSKWQLAGDLLPNATPEQILATGFNRNHPINGEGGRIAEENRIDYVMDMAETTGTIWMGLTFNCCRCHDHKYDQLSQDDYYSLFAFFNQTPINGGGGNAQTPPVLAVPSAGQKKRIAALKNRLAEFSQKMNQQTAAIADQQPAWEQAELAKMKSKNDWTIFKSKSFVATDSKAKTLPDDSHLIFGKQNPDNSDYRVTGTTKLETVSGVRLEVLNHPTMTKGGLSRSPSSNFVLTDFVLQLIEKQGAEPQQLKFSTAQADYEQLPVNHAIDDDPKTGWAVYAKDKDMQQEHEAVFKLAQPIEIRDGAELVFLLKHQSVHKQHNIGRFRISLTASESPSLFGVDAELANALKILNESRSDKQNQLLKERFLRSDKQFLALSKARDAEDAKLTKINRAVPKVMVMADMPKPRKSFRLNRGSYQEPLNEVFARVPEMFASVTKKPNSGKSIKPNVKPDKNSTDAQSLNRLDLANFLFEKSNPLTPRVSVNRLWAQFFSAGLVETTEDFGVQGKPPSHPILLDVLAREYRDSGWNTKQMIRLILNSKTYKQSSKVTPQLLELDPKNRLLGRASRFRMPAWMLRDAALASSGQLVRDLGGRPVNTYQPNGVWEEASFGKKKFTLDSGDSLYRRSLYTFWRRIAAPTMFFDNADRMTCSVKTFRTNTPLHALSTLNDTTFVEAARLLATNAISVSQTDIMENNDAETLNFIFERVLSRPASSTESRILLKALNRTRDQYSKNEKAAKEFIAIGKSPVDAKLKPVELASWTSLCLAVLNLDEALTRQ